MELYYFFFYFGASSKNTGALIEIKIECLRNSFDKRLLLNPWDVALRVPFSVMTSGALSNIKIRSKYPILKHFNNIIIRVIVRTKKFSRRKN